MSIEIVIVEDDPDMRALLAGKLRGIPGFLVVLETGSCRDATDFFADGAQGDVLLADLDLPDGSGLDVIRAATVARPGLEAIVISVFGDERHVFAALEAGASGYLLKDSLPEDLVATIELLRAGGAPINPMIARRLIKHLAPRPEAALAEPTALTEREMEILALLARGFSTAEVAGLLSISFHTVATHVKKIYRKLQVGSRAEAIYEAGQLGLLPQ